LAVWHGFNLRLMMSIAALVCGVTLSFTWRQFLALRHRPQVPVLHPLNGIKIFDSILQNAPVAAEGLLKVVATRHLQPQFMIILIGLLGALLLIVPLLSELQLQDVSAIDPFFAVLWIIGGACGVAAAWSAKYHRLAA